MGRFRQKSREGVREMRENSREATELGSEMRRQADEINAVLESIELQDDEDVRAVSEAGRSYKGSFEGAFSERVETSGQEIKRHGEQIQETNRNELGNVKEGISKMERAEKISEIGSEAAERGATNLEGSAEEYGDIIADSEGVVDDTDEQIKEIKNNLDRIFG